MADPDNPDDLQVVWEVPIAVGATWVGVEPSLPEPRPGAVYVISRVVAEHFPERADLVCDEHGEMVAAHSLACLHSMTRAD